MKNKNILKKKKKKKLKYYYQYSSFLFNQFKTPEITPD